MHIFVSMCECLSAKQKRSDTASQALVVINTLHATLITAHSCVTDAAWCTNASCCKPVEEHNCLRWPHMSAAVSKCVIAVSTCFASSVNFVLGMGMTTTCWGATRGGITTPCRMTNAVECAHRHRQCTHSPRLLLLRCAHRRRQYTHSQLPPTCLMSQLHSYAARTQMLSGCKYACMIPTSVYSDVFWQSADDKVTSLQLL